MAINVDEFNSAKNGAEIATPRPELMPADIAAIGSLLTEAVSGTEDMDEDQASKKAQEIELVGSLRLEAERVVQAIVYSNLTAREKPRAVSSKANRSEIAANEDIVKLYLDEMGKYPLLNKDKEAALGELMDLGKDAQKILVAFQFTEDERRGFLQAQATGTIAREWFIKTNLRLVVPIAKRYQNHGLDFADLISEGNIGVMQALNKFDWRKGFKFSTYATAWIRQRIDRALADQGTTVRLPVHATESVRKYWAAHDRLWVERAKKPTTQEVAKALFLTPEQLAQIEEDGRPQPYSLDEPLSPDNPDNGITFTDTVGDSSVDITGGAERDDLDRMIKKVMDECLEDQEVEVLKLRWNLDGGGMRSLEAVAKLLKMGIRKVRETEHDAIEKLADDGRLHDFLTD
jgi:RNA polymerase primary sigma factor